MKATALLLIALTAAEVAMPPANLGSEQAAATTTATL